MPRKPKVTLVGLEFVETLRHALRDRNGDGLRLTHRVAIASATGAAPLIYTVDLTPGTGGRFLATCRELSQVLTRGASEEEALVLVRLAIVEALGDQG